MSLINNIPNGGKPPKFEEQENHDPENMMHVLAYQEKCQAFWAAVQAAQNQQNQEATTESNLQKARHDAIMHIAGNIGRS